jgi:manganese-dependent inorganic pyrophosphatase
MSRMMETNDVVYVTGHKHPDSDSICSVIGYATLKQKLGVNAIACRLGDINLETEYLLKKFGFNKPMYLDDARSQLHEIEMDEAVSISPETTILEAYNLLEQQHKQALTVVNEKGQLLGMITNSNISRVAMGDTAKSIDLLKKTPIEYIAKTIKGKLIYTPEHLRINGKVSIVAIAANKLDNYELTDRIVIVGNDTTAQIEAMDKGAGCLIVVWANTVASVVVMKARETGCAVIISGHGTLNTSRYLFYSSPIKDIMTVDPISFNKLEYVDNVSKKIVKSRFRSYPVVDDKKRVFGLVSRYHLLNSKNKSLILLDHNESSQSVENVEMADIVEIIDHHRIGGIQTNKPIMFRNQLVGSTSTIVALMYEENKIELDPKMSGLLLGAVISDTLNFNSPTTTPVDIALAKRLAAKANIDTEAFAKELFSMGSSLKDRDLTSIIEHDLKEYSISNMKLMLGQMNLYFLDEVKDIKEQLLLTMENYCVEKKLDLLLMIFTSIEKNGSVMYYAGKHKWIVEEAYPTLVNGEDILIEHVVSRKKQIIPRLSVVIQEKGQ